MSGNEFNIGSTKQLGDVLFEKLQLPGGKKGKTGAYGTDASILETLAPLHPVPAQVLEWRQLTKLKSTYADALGEEYRRRDRPGAHLLRAGRDRHRAAVVVRAEHPEHPDPHRGRAKNPPRLCRRAGASAAVGRLQPDRIAARRACRRYRGAEATPSARGIDIHALTASEVFGVPLDRMDPLTRRRAKAINFGIIYGISAFGLGNQIGVPQYEAAEYIRAYLDRFPAIRAYMERIKAEARRAGYVETIFGRKCFIPGIRDANPARRAGAERQAINAPLQGAAADIIKRAMGRLPAALAAAGLQGAHAVAGA